MTTKRTALRARNSSIQAAIVAAQGEGHEAVKGVPVVKNDAIKEKTIGLTLRLTSETHDQLRRTAFEKRVSIHSLLLEGVDVVLRKYHQ